MKIGPKLVFGFLIVIILTLFVARTAIYYQQKIFESNMRSVIEGVENEFHHVKQADTDNLSAVLEVISRDQKFKDIFLEKDREKLYDFGRPLFETLKDEYGITHFYFILPDGRCFLRLHNKEMAGDQITRATFEKARDTKQTASGFELGKTAYALRVVKPYYNGDELIGYVELGEEIDHFLDILKGETRSDFAIAVNKKQLDMEKWESTRRMAGKKNNWHDFKEIIPIGATKEEILKTIIEFASTKLNRIVDDKDFWQETQIDNEGYILDGFRFKDARDQDSGIVLAIIDASELTIIIDKASSTMLYITVFLCVVALMAGLLISFSISLPLTKLRDATIELGKGNFKTTLEIDNKDEIGDLAASFQAMTNNLRETTLSKDYVSNIIDSMTEFLVVISPDGTITTANRTVREALGYSEDELIGKEIRIILSEEESNLSDDHFATIISQGALLDYETIFRTKNGEKILVELNSGVMKDRDGEVESMVLIAKDITEKRKSEEQLHTMSIIAQQSPNAIVVTDKEGTIEYVNPAFVDVTGYSFNEAIGKNPRILNSGKNSPELYNDLWKTITSGGIWRGEFQNKKKNGELFWEMCSISSIKNNRGNITHYLAIKEDITKKKNNEEELKQANEDLRANERALKNLMYDMKKTNEELKSAQAQLVHSEKLSSLGQLSAGIAHEINNPLGFIDNNISVLEEYVDSYSQILRAVDILKKTLEAKDVDRAMELVDEMNKLEEKVNMDFISSDIENLIRQSKSGAERIKKIVQDLRTFARKDEGQVELNNIEDVIDGVITIVWNEIKYKAELKKEYSGIPLVRCNAQKIGQVFINLLVNAAQAIKEHGEITVKTFVDGKFAFIQVTDTGSGIKEEDLKNIFDPFFTTKEVGKGTGLGLSIGYDIVQQHKGDMEVQSEIGKGTTFTVKLPV